MTAHQFKVGDRVEVVAPDPIDGWAFIKGPGVGTIVDCYGYRVAVSMDDDGLMNQASHRPHPQGWAIDTSCIRPLSPPAPTCDHLTATALELAEAVADYTHDVEPERYPTPKGRRFATALRAYREARRPDPRARLRALIEAHGGDDREALLAALEAAP